MILLYHDVSPAHDHASGRRSASGADCHHSPEGFERHLRRLLDCGYEFQRLEDAVATIKETASESGHSAQITFDDGLRSQYEYALPILRRLGLTATFFVTTQHLAAGTDDAAVMSRDQLLRLVDQGMTIGGHTRTHPRLTGLSDTEAMEEIAGCRHDLERALGIPVTLFAYPGGEFDSRIADIVRAAGYVAACSVLGPATNDPSSLYWLYRVTFTEDMRSLGDQYRLSPTLRSLLQFRVKRRLRNVLAP